MRALAAFLLSAAAAAAQPIDLRVQSLQDIRNAIGWYGASCVMTAVRVPGFDGDETLDRIVEESGLDLETIQAWAAQRGAEHAVAVEVLTRGQEPPYDDPPEPFLMILRQAQSDCQTLQMTRNRLQAAIDRGTLPDQRGPAEAPILRLALDPLPFDHERWRRLAWVIEHIPSALAAGVAEDDLQALFAAITDRADLDIARYATVTSRRDAERMALALLVPARRVVSDMTRDELVEIARRVLAQDDLRPEGRPRLELYYLEMFRINTGGHGTPDLFFEPDPDWLSRIVTNQPSAEQIVDEALRHGGPCFVVPIIGLEFCTVAVPIRVD